MYCIAPAGGAIAAMPVAVSLNAQQYDATPQPYTRIEDPNITDAASPTSGPVLGGTLISIVAPGIVSGDDFRCRFTPVPSAESGDTRASVAAAIDDGLVSYGTYVQANDSVVCYSPAANRPADALENATLQVAFNGLHFYPVAPFQFYAIATISAVRHARPPQPRASAPRTNQPHGPTQVHSIA